MFGQISINFWAQKSTNAVLPTLCLRSKYVLPTFFYTLPPTEALQEALQALKMTWGGIRDTPTPKASLEGLPAAFMGSPATAFASRFIIPTCG